MIKDIFVGDRVVVYDVEERFFRTGTVIENNTFLTIKIFDKAYAIQYPTSHIKSGMYEVYKFCPPNT